MACFITNFLLVIPFLLFDVQISQARTGGVRTKVFLSSRIDLEPGLVSNKLYYGMKFPRGHIAIKSLDGELVDAKGKPVPLHDVYLHHWIIVRYYQRKGVDLNKHQSDLGFLQSNMIPVKNSGICESGLVQYFGLGSETRKTRTYIPDPYGIEVGDPAGVPEGFEEKWLLNVHAIDTRGTQDRVGCFECRCDLYNRTVASYGGGLRCCVDGSRCRLKDGFSDVKRSIYLKYTIRYLHWNAAIRPVNVYIFDITAVLNQGDEAQARHPCQVEYDVEACSIGAAKNRTCIDTRTLSIALPEDGDVIYGVGHIHAGGINTTLYGEGGKEICSSYPLYGTGQEAGNEAGYIVGMSTCYPSPGSIKILPGEKLTFVSNYNNTKGHTGVMGLFYLLVANSSVKTGVPHG